MSRRRIRKEKGGFRRERKEEEESRMETNGKELRVKVLGGE